MKNVVVLIHDDPGQESRLQTALDLTRALTGHLTCLQVTVPPDLPPDVAIAVGGGTLMPEAIEREGTNRLRTQQRLAVEDVSWNWIETSGDLGAAMHGAFGLADIIVVSRALDSFLPTNMARVAADVIIASEKPVVAVPETAREFAASENALIAWNGSMQASAAVTACVPLLKKAAKVTILEIDDDRLEVPAEEAASYLSRHGVHARIVRQTKGKADVSDLILQEARRHNAAYILIGGFGRNRVAEAFFGGVTHELLKSSSLPLVLVH